MVCGEIETEIERDREIVGGDRDIEMRDKQLERGEQETGIVGRDKER